MGTTADLPDLKVWLALAWPEHSRRSGIGSARRRAAP
jgi:hypothetical protein